MEQDCKLVNALIDPMVILTLIIAASVAWQAWITYRAEKRYAEMERPKIKISLYSRFNFQGFQATNIGRIDVTITSMILECPTRDKPEEYGTISITGFPGKIEFRGDIICDPRLPYRLSPGDSVLSIYPLDELENVQRDHETGKTIRLRPKCEDSIGNEYHGPWVTWKNKTTTLYNGPGPGYITPEEGEKRLKKNRKRQRWKKMIGS